MIKKIAVILLSLIIIAGLCACDNNKQNNSEKYSSGIWDCFDTYIGIMAYCESQEEFDSLFTQAESDFLYYNKLFDIYTNYEGINNIKSINDNAGTAPVKVEREIIDLILLGKDLYEETDGNVNIAFGAVLKEWHKAREIANDDPSKAYVPDIELLKECALHCDIDKVIIDIENSTVYLSDKDMSLDVGAIAKGFATELVAENIKQSGKSDFLITSGESSIKAGSKKPNGDLWTSLVRNDPDENIIYLENTSISTSGSYENYYEYEGRLYHHIINKDSLMPENSFLSVTVITGDSGRADALSTAIFNMSLEEGLSFVNSVEGLEAMWIDNDYNVTYSDSYRSYYK